MRRKIKLIALLIAILMFIGTCAGCAKTEIVDIHTPTYVDASENESISIDLAMEMVPLTASPAMFSISTPSAPGTLVKQNDKAVIDYSNSSDGYVMVRYKNNTNKQLRVIISGPRDTKYTYTLKQNGDYEVYPFSAGNGSYSIGVYEQIEGNRYSTAISASIDVRLRNEFAPFLFPNQYVNFTARSQTALKAAELVRNARNLTEQISAIYNYVISNLTYDRNFADEVRRGLHSGYVPNVDSVLARGKGICFDYAAVMTAMLRSQGVPTRLVIGYAGDVYHAWIDVYSEEEGWINNVIFFDGEHWKLMDPTFASTGGQSDSVMQYIGDGRNYTAKYLY